MRKNNRAARATRTLVEFFDVFWHSWSLRRRKYIRLSNRSFYLVANINVEQKFVNSWLKFKILQIIKGLVIPYANKAFFNLGKIVSTIICPCPLLPFVQDVYRFFLVFKHMTFKVWSRQKSSLFIVIFLLTGIHGSMWQSVKSSYCYNVKKFDEFFVVYLVLLLDSKATL